MGIVTPTFCIRDQEQNLGSRAEQFCHLYHGIIHICFNHCNHYLNTDTCSPNPCCRANSLQCAFYTVIYTFLYCPPTWGISQMLLHLQSTLHYRSHLPILVIRDLRRITQSISEQILCLFFLLPKWWWSLAIHNLKHQVGLGVFHKIFPAKYVIFAKNTAVMSV